MSFASKKSQSQLQLDHRSTKLPHRGFAKEEITPLVSVCVAFALHYSIHLFMVTGQFKFICSSLMRTFDFSAYYELQTKSG